MDRRRLLPVLSLLALAGCGGPQTTIYLDLTRVPADFSDEPFDASDPLPDELVASDDGGAPADDLTVVNPVDMTATNVDLSRADLLKPPDLRLPDLRLPDLVTTAPPTNDSCTGAATLTFSSGKATVVADTTAAVADTSGTCGGSGPDVVYTFTTTQAQKITVTAVPLSSPSFEPLIYLRKVCSSTTSANELGCNDAGASGSTATFTVASAPAGTYWLWIDGFAGSLGRATVTVTLGAPPTPPETCAAAQPIFLGTPIIGDTTSAAGDMGGLLSSTCASAGVGGMFNGRDLVYAYTPSSSGTVTVTLHPTGVWDPALWAMTTCQNDGSTCNAAADSGFDSDDETLQLTVTAAKPYFIVVDSYSSAAAYGPFTLQVQ